MLLRASLVSSFLLLVACGGDPVYGHVYFKKGSPHVTLPGGVLSGEIKSSRDGRPYTLFSGIQYATIPSRFEPPQPISEPWEGVQFATSPGFKCPEPKAPSGGSALGGNLTEDEDCLNLNVYVPMSINSTAKRGYAVMVWIHGGGFTFGAGYGYGGSFFMDEDVVLVTINYRLGVFGFLSTGDNVIPGNNGLKDQVIALKWVQENIKAFGGDPNKVTIVGESAGAASVHYLMLSPTSKGLFHRAIAQSGSAIGLWAFQAQPKVTAVDLATHLGCPTTGASPSDITSQEILTCLKGLPMDELKQGHFTFRQSWPGNYKHFFFVPTAEPEATLDTTDAPFLTESPISILLGGKYQAEVPLMIGANEDEGCVLYSGIILNKDSFLAELESNWDTLAPRLFDFFHYFPLEKHSEIGDKIRKFYFGTQPISADTRQNLTNLFTDALIVHSVYRAAVETASRGKRHPVYLYQYAYPGPLSLLGMIHQITSAEASMVGHGDELQHQFDFGNLGGASIIKEDSPNEEFSKNFIKLWASFAIHGEPKYTWGNATLRKFKDMSKKELDGTFPLRWFRLESNPTSVEDPYKDRMTFWNELWESSGIYPSKPGPIKAGEKAEL